MPEILFLSPFPAAKTSFSITLITNICLPFKSLLRGLFDFRIAMQIPLPAIALGISMKSISKHLSRRPVFHPKIMPFLCPENAPRKCKWLQCVRLGLNKRRPSPDVSAAPQRHPRASRSGADQAHTLSRTNRPLNRLNAITQKQRTQETRLHDETRGGERSPPR